LGVKPDKRTNALYQNIRADQGESDTAHAGGDADERPRPLWPTCSDGCTQIQTIVVELQRRSQKEISSDELTVKDPAG
jgi:hypothetical protein